MSEAEYRAEISLMVASEAVVKQHACGLWMAYLSPVHDAVRNGLQPPGQINEYRHGDAAYTAVNKYTGILPVGFSKDGPIWEVDTLPKAERLEARVAWAARPWFRSADAAERMMVGWIWDNRPDIVQAARDHVAQAMAYRSSKGAK